MKNPRSLFLPTPSRNSVVPSSVVRNRAGQVVIEYVLLLVIAVAVAALISKELVSRDSGNPGILVQKWLDIQNTIGSDVPDKKD